MRIFALLLFVALISCGSEDTTSSEILPEELIEEVIEEMAEESLEVYEADESYDLSKIQFQGEYDGCLPEIDPTFLRWMEQDSLRHFFPWSYELMYMYTSTHLDSVSTKSITKRDTMYEMSPLVWEQYFEGGIKFGFEQYPEAGATGYISTPCTDKQNFIRILYPLMFDEENTWNEDSTEYGPDGAGCYYNFTRDSINSSLTVDWYCGC
jgi:hypothetical protein